MGVDMAEYRKHRLDRTWVQVTLDEVFEVFFVEAMIREFALDTWLDRCNQPSGRQGIDGVPDDVLVEWIEQQRWRVTGGNNEDGSEFEEYREKITLSSPERAEAARRVRNIVHDR